MAENRLKEEDAGYYVQQHEIFSQYLNRNEFLIILETLDAVTTKKTSLLTTDVKTQKLNRVTMEEALENRAKFPGQKIKCYVGHPASSSRRGQTTF